jgi:hypothetical protein
MYKVIRKFEDKDGRIYKIGDDFPHVDAKKPTNARIKTLSTTNNHYGKIYIKKIEA